MSPNSLRAGGWLLGVGLAFCLAVPLGGACNRPRSRDLPELSPRSSATSVGPRPTGLEEPGAIDLLDPLRHGAIDVTGPVVDLGEPENTAFVLHPIPRRVDEVNGDSWAAVGARLRLRVPIDPRAPPDRVRFRVRRARARRVLALVDGVPVRQVAIPEGPAPHVVELPIAPERFARESAMIELRFFSITREQTAVSVPRSLALAPARPAGESPGARDGRDAGGPGQPAAAPTVAEVDWVHACRAEGVVARAADLVADVRVDRTPRRSLTLYPPTRASWVTVLPAAATLRTAVAAEGVRGGPARAALARVRIDVDDLPSIEREIPVRVGDPWRDVTLDLGPFAHRAARITVEASSLDERDGGQGGPLDASAASDVRVAFADPRLLARTPAAPALPGVRHALFVLVRGLRADRIVPTVHGRMTGGGFARMTREGVVARAVAPSGHELASLATMLTGLSPQAHRIEQWTDTLDERAPTVGSIARESGVATGLFTDDAWLLGSGLDRGYGETRACPGDVARCRAEVPLGLATEWLVRQRDRRALAVVVTRAGLPPFDPPRDLLLALDPNPPENALQSEGTAQYALNPRVLNEGATFERVQVLYDGAIANVDRALAQSMDRLREAGMLDASVVLVVGDRGTALGEERWIGEGPARLAVVHETALMLRAQGMAPRALGETVAATDGLATVLDRLGVQGPWRGPFAPVSLSAAGPLGVHPLGFVAALGPGFAPALRFGSLLALPTRWGSEFSILAPGTDPLAMELLQQARPIAVAFAQQRLSEYLDSGGCDVDRYAPSTRALPEPVAAALRQGSQHR